MISGTAFSDRTILCRAAAPLEKISATNDLHEGRGCPTGGPPQALHDVFQTGLAKSGLRRVERPPLGWIKFGLDSYIDPDIFDYPRSQNQSPALLAFTWYPR